MKSAGAIFPNRRPSNLPFTGRNHLPISNESACKRERKKIAITNQTKRDPRSLLHFSRDRIFFFFFFFFATYLFVDGTFHRFVEGMCVMFWVVKRGTRNGRQIELCRQEYNGSEETEEERGELTGERITESVIKK